MNGDRGALATLSNALSELEELNDNPQYQNTYERMYDLYYNLIDLDDEIINEFNSTNFDEYRLNEIQEVFFKLNRLKRKYGQSIEAIKEAKEDLEMKVAAFNNRETYLNDLKKQLDIAYQETKSVSASSKIIVSTELEDKDNILIANIILDISPPEATLFNGFNVCPAFVEIKNSTLSCPFF